MEKYSTWRDPGTGIQPFLHLPSKPYANSIVNGIATYLIKPIVTLLKLPFLLLSLILLFVTNSLPSNISTTVVNLSLRFLLTVLGFYNLQLEYVKPKLSTKANSSTTNKDEIDLKDVLLCNFSSIVDVLILKLKFNPTFTLLDTSTGNLAVVDFSYFLLNTTGLTIPFQSTVTNLDSKFKFVSLPELYETQLQLKTGPIVIFLEGCTTNGKGILKPNAKLMSYINASSFKIHLVGIQYPYQNVPSTQPIYNSVYQLVQLSSRFVNSIKIKVGLEHHLNLQPDSSSHTSLARLQKLAALSNTRLLSLDANAKMEFLKYYFKK